MLKIIEVKYLPNSRGEISEHKLNKITQGDWIDLYVNEDVELKAGQFALVGMGVAMKLPEGYEAHLAPRSSTFKNYHVIQTNSVGIIDNSYCGDGDEWKMPVYAVQDTKIERGSRICQFRIVEKQPTVKFCKVETLGSPDRGGFGSTGK